MDIKKHGKKITAVVVAGAAVIGSLGVAYAWWSTTGTGSDTASTTAGVADELSFAHDALTPMFPGDVDQDLIVTVTNDSGESVYVTTVKAWITTDKTGCDGDDFLINGAEAPSTLATAVALPGWTAQEITAGDSASSAGDDIQFNDKAATNQDVCKSAAVTVHYTVPALP